MQKKRLALFGLILALTSAACLATGAPQAQSTSSAPPPAADVVFKTPEDAINAYMQGVAQNDIQKIAQACAINEMSEKFKFDLYTQRLGGIFMPAQFLSPATSPFFIETNKMKLSGQIFDRVKMLTYSLLSSENVSDGSPITGMDAGRIEAFMKDLDPKRLSGLAVEQIVLPNKTLMSDAKYLDNANKMALIYGADEQTERVVLFSFEKNEYFIGFTLLRYGQNWKISSQISALSNSNQLGAAQKITPTEFQNMNGGG